MVYRRSNAELVETLLRKLPADADVRLWALDEVAPALAANTMGVGTGLRFFHLNWLYQASAVSPNSWVVVADDDVIFLRGDLGRMVKLMKQAGFSLAQPAQSYLGWWSTFFNVARPLLIARDTNYVEQGPLVVIAPDFVRKFFPLPEYDDMGWGVEAEWYEAKGHDFRFGIVDACRIVHWHPRANSYSVEAAAETMNQRLLELGIGSIWQLQSTNGYWWKWQKNASWTTN
jgi:hypothetical protein